MTKNEKYIVDMYVRYFGRAADAATIATYAEDKKTSVILKNIIADADAEKAELSTSDFVNNAFQNLFGRNATTKDMNKYSKVVEKGKDLPINSIVKSAAKADKAVYDNKIAVANKNAELGGAELDLSKISKGNLIDLNFLNTVTKAADLKAKVDALADNSGIPSSFDGKTFFLTTGVDAGKDFTGTNKGDLFIADNSVTVKTSAADTLDGGKGVDTFKLYDDATGTTAGSLPTLKNIENVVIYDNKVPGGSVDLKKWDSVETLFLVRDGATTYDLGEKVTTVNIEDKAATTTLNFNGTLAAATVGVNNVTGANTVTVTGAALKTLTVDASGKASNVNLTQATIETLNITGKANLTLDAASTLTAVKTIDGSKAEGKLDLDLTGTTAATLKTVKTGTGDDKLTVSINVASGTTIDLGAGNDKLVKGAGTIAAGSIIDGGAGIDSLDAGLVNAGNVGVFANFETLSLTTTNVDFDITLLNKSTFTTIAIDGANTSTVRNVSTSQSLTVNATGTSTTLLFKDVAGTADAYTINFAKDAAPTAPATTVNAGTVIIDKIETVTVNSTGKTATTGNIIKLDGDAAKSLVITGDKAIDVTFIGTFGDTTASAANGLGVATIDASAATGAVTINTTNVTAAVNGLTIKGGTAGDSITLAGHKATVDAGAGDDTIITAGAGGTLTGGAGKDTFNIAASKLLAGELTEANGVVKVTITDLTAGDTIKFAAHTTGTEAFNKTKVDVSGALNLDNALTAAFAGDGSTNGIINWFQFAGNTYIVEDVTVANAATAGDIVVKINGVVDLSNSAYDATSDTLTIA